MINETGSPVDTLDRQPLTADWVVGDAPDTDPNSGNAATPDSAVPSSTPPTPAETPSPSLPVAPELQQGWVVSEKHVTDNPIAEFQKKLDQFRNSPVPNYLDLVLERFSTTDEKGVTHSISELPPTDAAALLQAIESNPESVSQTTAVDALRAFVTETPAAAQLYYSEKYTSSDAATLTTEVATVAAQVSEDDRVSEVSGAQLTALHEVATARSQELSDPGAQESLSSIEQALSEREADVLATTNTIIELTGEAAEAAAVPKDAQITNVTNENGEVTTEFTDANGNKTRVVAKEPNIWGMLLIMIISDALVGTRSIDDLLQRGMTELVTLPLLGNLGIDTTEMRDRLLLGGEVPILSKLLEVTENSEQVAKFFEHATDNKTLYPTLNQLTFEDRQRIFDPAGTKPFGGTGFAGILTNGRFQLPQELVDRMYSKLSDAERVKLRIPTSAVAQAA